MTRFTRPPGWLVILALGGAMLVATTPTQAEHDRLYKALIERVDPALVTVKFVLKTQGSYGGYDSETEIVGTMIKPEGLVLCAGRALGGMSWSGQSTPTDLKVLIGDDTEGLPAKVIARDTELGLAWVRIKDVGDKKFDYVDLTETTTAELGKRLLTVGRMGRFFDRAPLVTEGVMAGQASKPRYLIVAGGPIDMTVGLPVYGANGKVVGVPVSQQPDDEDLEHSSGRSYALMGSTGSGLILPAHKVVQATARALQVAQEDEEEEAEAEAETEADQDDE
ncbi:MAG: trypsin-like peptidase domain-containing protein [Planctomycetota bacterium]